MSSLTERLPFVKEQRDRVQRIIDRHPDDPRSQTSYLGVVRGFDGTIKAIEEAILRLSEIERNPRTMEPISGSKIVLRPSDIRGLPPELIKSLSLTDSDFIDFQIIDVINAGGGVMSLDHILIGLYQETEKIHDRIKTSQRIYRMGTKGKIFNVKGMKAVYTTRKDMIEMDQEHLTGKKDVKRNPETIND